jgi:hypothetical protein
MVFTNDLEKFLRWLAIRRGQLRFRDSTLAPGGLEMLIQVPVLGHEGRRERLTVSEHLSRDKLREQPMHHELERMMQQINRQGGTAKKRADSKQRRPG